MPISLTVVKSLHFNICMTLLSKENPPVSRGIFFLLCFEKGEFSAHSLLVCVFTKYAPLVHLFLAQPPMSRLLEQVRGRFKA